MYNVKKYGNNITNTYFKEDTMEASNLKNMVVLKNLPSNIVDEAIIVLKTNKKAKKLQKIEKNNQVDKEEKKDKDDVLKEAEMLVNSYISKVEIKDIKKENVSQKQKNRYEKLKKYSIATTVLCIIQAIIIIF